MRSVEGPCPHDARAVAVQSALVRLRKSILLGLFVGALGMLLRPTSIGVRLEEEVGLRALFAFRGPIAPPPDVVVVSVDKGSAQQLGMEPDAWPPPRRIHCR